MAFSEATTAILDLFVNEPLLALSIKVGGYVEFLEWSIESEMSLN